MLIIPDKQLGVNAFADVIDYYTRKYCSELVSDQTIEDLVRVTRHLPALFSSNWGFELRPFNAIHGVDFLACVHEPEQLVARPGVEGQVSFPETFRPVIDAWQDKRSILHEGVKNIWFEIDQEHLGLPDTPFNFFIGPVENASPLALADLLAHLVSLTSDGLLTEFKPALQQLFRAKYLLQDPSWIAQVGIMRARQQSGFRVFIQDISRQAATGFLQGMSYPALDREDLWKCWDALENAGARMALNVDLGRTIGPKLGLEAYFKTVDAAKDYLQEWAEENHAEPSQYHALMRFMSQLDGQQDGPLQPIFSHLKLVYVPDVFPELKAYFGFAKHKTLHLITYSKP